MTKSDFKSRVKGLFSVRWLKNDGTEGYVHRGILGTTKRLMVNTKNIMIMFLFTKLVMVMGKLVDGQM